MSSYSQSKIFSQRLNELVNHIQLHEVLMHDYKIIQAEITVHEAATVLMNCHNKYFIVMDGANPVGLLHRIDVVIAVAEMRYDEMIKNLPLKKMVFLKGSSEVKDVLDEISKNIEHIYPVMEGDNFLGVINYHHIIEYLLIHKSSDVVYQKVRSLATML